MITPAETIYEVMGFHIDLSTISDGESIQCPDGWIPLGMAMREGNDLVILLSKQIA